MSFNKVRFTLILGALLLVPTLTYADSKSDFHNAMRRLWSDHVVYTRLFIVDAAAGSADKDATTQRLLQNQADIGNAVGGNYDGRAGDNAKVTSENKRWHDNAVDLAKFLHGANPKNWPEATLQSALFMHLDQTLSEASNQLKGNYAMSIKDYDKAMDHMLMVADILANGIVAQFPAKFSNAGGSKK